MATLEPSESRTGAFPSAATGAVRALDLDFVRRQFPALDSDWICLDNAGGSHVLAAVADRVREYMLSTSVQLGATYGPSRLAAERVAEGVRAAAALVNAADPSEIVLGPSSSQLVASLARAMAEDLRPGDEIVVTNVDHEANITPWLRLAERGVLIKTWKASPETLELDLADLGALMNERTRLVCFPHVSNVLGTLCPVAEITRFVHDRQARVCVDGVAYAPHRAVDVRAWDVDFYVFSLYKVYGPHQALMYGKRELLLDLANINHVFIGKDALPYKLLPGNLNFELTYGLPAIVAYLEELGRQAGEERGEHRLAAAFAAIAEHEERLAEPVLSFLAGKPNVRLYGCPSPGRDRRVPTISFSVDGRHSSEIPTAIDGYKIGIRYGDFHARRLIADLGLTDRGGVVRVSMAHYNTLGEMEKLVQALDEVL
jgi:cysteine desulfurase family protein (TIGR01976 family)